MSITKADVLYDCLVNLEVQDPRYYDWLEQLYDIAEGNMPNGKCS